MKKIFLIIGLAVVMSNASCGLRCNDNLERIANALDRIATSMEKQQIQAQKDTSPKKQEITSLNGRSLKAIPTDPYSIMDKDEINQCIDDCKVRFSLYNDRVDCIKRFCGEDK